MMKFRFIQATKNYPFWKRATYLYFPNPGGWNLNGVITIIGLIVWSACALGDAYGLAEMPTYVAQIGTMLFGFGAGRASNKPVSE